MKFLTETVENVQVDIQESALGVKDYYITGIFMQSGIKNKNGRVYPPEVLAREMNRYTQDQIANKRSVGELNHPNGPQINLDKVSHMITSLWVEGQNIYGKAKILNTPQGQIVKTLIDEGVQLGVSTRGFGTVKEVAGTKIVQNDFRLATIDIVQDPSCQSAYVSTLMESKEFFVDADGNIKERDPSIIVEDVKEDSITKTTEELSEGFMKYNSDDHVSDTEISKFDGGYRPKVKSKEDGRVIHLSQYSYPEKKQALEAADIYRTNYSKIHDDRLHTKLMNHWKKHHSVFENVLLEKFENALNEISKVKLSKYVKAASKDLAVTSQLQGSEIEKRNSAENENMYKTADKNVQDYGVIRSKRSKGIAKAVDKLTEEQIDEVSKATLGSYVKKASKDVETRTTDSASFTSAAERHLDQASKLDKHMKFKDSNDSRKAADQYYRYSDKEAAKVNKRQKGISKAVDKLTKE